MTLQYRRDGNQIIVFGKTYDHRDFIKSLGGRFSGESKVWLVPFSETNIERLDAAISGYAATSSIQGVKSQASEQSTSDPALGLRISELISRAGAALNAAFPAPIWVVGEIHNVASKTSGLFFSLAEAKDGTSTGVATLEVKATLWRSQLASIESVLGKAAVDAVLQDGMQVRMLCQVGLYRDRAQVSLNIINIDPAYTKGALALAREALLRELRSKGLDRLNKQLPEPTFPFAVGLISSPGSRAYSDFTEQLWSYGFPGTIYFAAAATQGEAVATSVCRAIKQLAQAECDIIVITRGGGSAADLRWFDGKEIAYAIAECPVPVVAAIGHHDDVSVAELLAYAHEKTPTAAADFVNNCFQKTRASIQAHAMTLAQSLLRRTEAAARLQEQIELRLQQAAQFCLGRVERALSELARKLEGQLKEKVSRSEHLIAEIFARLQQQFVRYIHAEDLRLGDLYNQLTKLDPTPWLKAGWTQLMHQGKPLRSVMQVTSGDAVSARLLDGSIHLHVDKTQAKNKKGDLDG